MYLLVSLIFILQVLTPTFSQDENDITVENFMDIGNAESVYFPANRMDQRGFVYYNQQPRVFPLTKTIFGITFNPQRCFPQGHNDVHRVVLSFMDDWREDMEIKPAHVFKNAYVIHRNVEFSMDGNYQNQEEPVHGWDYYYTITRYINGSKFPGVVHGMKMNILNLELSVRIGENQSIVAFVNGRDEIRGMQNTVFYPVVLPIPKSARFFAIFASEQDACPAFVSSIDDSFPAWSPHKGLKHLKGLVPKEKEPTTVLRDLFIAVCLCIVYCWALINYLVPWLLNIVYPQKKATSKKNKQA